MMKVKFNKFERVAGFFLLFSLVGTILVALTVAAKQGWFESKTYFVSTFDSAEGVHQGTLVQMSGLRAGSVEDVELLSSNKIKVHFYVLGKFKDRIHTDSRVQLIRPFVIGERVLDVSVGSENTPVQMALTEIPSVETLDLMSLMSGRKVNNSIEKFSSMLENLEKLAKAFLDKNRTDSMIRALDRVDPLMRNLNNMSIEFAHVGKQLNHEGDLQKMVANLVTTTQEFNKILPELNRQNPMLAKDLGQLTQNLALVVTTMAPAIKEMGPEMPQTSHRLVEALNETVVLLKAMQKSFLLRGNVEEVHKEESQRLPANSK